MAAAAAAQQDLPANAQSDATAVDPVDYLVHRGGADAGAEDAFDVEHKSVKPSDVPCDPAVGV